MTTSNSNFRINNSLQRLECRQGGKLVNLANGEIVGTWGVDEDGFFASLDDAHPYNYVMIVNDPTQGNEPQAEEEPKTAKAKEVAAKVGATIKTAAAKVGAVVKAVVLKVWQGVGIALTFAATLCYFFAVAWSIGQIIDALGIGGTWSAFLVFVPLLFTVGLDIMTYCMMWTMKAAGYIFRIKCYRENNYPARPVSIIGLMIKNANEGRACTR